MIKSLKEGELYKYLGLEQSDEIDDEKAKEQLTKAYYNRLKMIVKTGLTCARKFAVIERWALPKLQYSFGIVKWTKDERRKIDETTRKILQKHGIISEKSATDLVYLSRRLGGRGLKNIEQTYQETVLGLDAYFEESSNRAMLTIQQCGHDIETPFTRLERAAENIRTENEVESKLQLKGVKQKRRKDQAAERDFAGKYIRICEEPGMETIQSLGWHRREHLTDWTENQIFKIRENLLPTRARLHQWKMIGTKNCRYCGNFDETIDH